MRENIMPLISQWISVRSWAALHCNFYSAEIELAAYTAAIHGDADELREACKLVAQDAGFSLEEIQWSKPRTKTPSNEKGTRAYAIRAYEKLAAKRFVPMAFSN